jgi:hypothetical protein
MVTVVLNFRRLATFKLKEMAKAAGFDDRSECAWAAPSVANVTQRHVA